MEAEHGSLLLRQLQKMWAAEELTDVVLVAEGIPFSCHKVVLSAFSPYFQVNFHAQRSSECSSAVFQMLLNSRSFVSRPCSHAV